MGRRSYYSVNKRQKDIRKKEKAERKRQRRQERRENGVSTATTDENIESQIEDDNTDTTPVEDRDSQESVDQKS